MTNNDPHHATDLCNFKAAGKPAKLLTGKQWQPLTQNGARTWLILLLLICAGLTPTASHAHQVNLRQALGKNTAILDKHKSAKAARLKIVTVAESKKHALKSSKRIAGYPLTGKSRKIKKEHSQQLAKLLQADNVFIHKKERCANKHFHGMRFSKGKQKVEVVVGVPCNQVAVAFKDGKEVKWWGGVMSDVAFKRVLQLLGE